MNESVAILKYPHPSLLKVSEPITNFNGELTSIVSKLRQAMASPPWGKALGMSAPQIGVNKRVFIALGMVFVNPVIVAKSPEMRVMMEACYSLEDKKSYSVQRYRWIVLEWYTERAEYKKRRWSRFDAEVIQHEFSHLEGKLCSGETHT